MTGLSLNRLQPEQELAGPVPEEALAFFRAKNLKPAFSYLDVWNEEHSAAFTAAKFLERDALAALQQGVANALAQGQTSEQFRSAMENELSALGFWGRQVVTDPLTGLSEVVEIGARRLELIYSVNLRTARAAGQYERVQRTKALRPYLQYGLGPSKVHRDQHAAWDGMILPVDHPFWQQGWPPSGFGCKCVVRQISAREAERLGGPRENFEPEYTTSRNKRTGKTVRHLVGVHPSFAHSPADRFAGLRAAAE